jgi:hypothetical protein
MVLSLNVDKREITLQKKCLLRAMLNGEGEWTAEEEESFTRWVLVGVSLSLRSDKGRLIYQTPMRYRVQFADHHRDVSKDGLGIMDEQLPLVGLEAGGVDLAREIETSMPTRISNKDGSIFFIKIVSHTFPDKEAHKHIIYEYIL